MRSRCGRGSVRSTAATRQGRRQCQQGCDAVFVCMGCMVVRRGCWSEGLSCHSAACGNLGFGEKTGLVARIVAAAATMRAMPLHSCTSSSPRSGGLCWVGHAGCRALTTIPPRARKPGRSPRGRAGVRGGPAEKLLPGPRGVPIHPTVTGTNPPSARAFSSCCVQIAQPGRDIGNGAHRGGNCKSRPSWCKHPELLSASSPAPLH